MKTGILSYFKQYKVIYIQVVVFTIIGLYKHNQGLMYFSALLLVLPLISGKLSAFYIKTLDYILNKIGLWLRYMLFFIFYLIVLCPVALFFYRRKQETGYIDYQKELSEDTFRKMW
ncbi:MAG: hypothetical protein IPM95_07615 [Sphingobacteriales bacterium]|jgi:hypothetical protein|nr:hypothetical protein [Sphingobacteriales bacterium]